MNDLDFRDALRDRDTWDQLVSDPDVAPQALTWLTDTIAHVSQQLSDAKAEIAGVRLPADEYRDLMEWRASALNFRRVAESRKRELVALIKRQNVVRSEASSATQLARLRGRLWKLCERYEYATPMADEVRAIMREVES